MERVFSAGGIIFKQERFGFNFLLARNKSISRPEVDYWGFPKGHLEKGETSETAALREVLEETGAKAEIVSKVGQAKYIYTSAKEGGKIFKVVTLFLMKYISGEIQPQDGEISEVIWLPKDQVLSTLSFKEDKLLFEKALGMING